MGKKDPRVDAYIGKAAPFASPILTHIRSVVHAACPTVEETIKWGFPHFLYEGILCSMAAFKEHCALLFWKAGSVVGHGPGDSMGQFGRIRTIDDLPSRPILTRHVKAVMKLNETRPKAPPKKTARRTARPVELPKELAAALRKNPAAAKEFAAFPPSHKRDYADWIAEAKGEDTRRRRLETAVEWISEGKSRNWKYERTRR
jgi:uncharacterized protein YdeI (YjbR/CyaY-like superfamily)